MHSPVYGNPNSAPLLVQQNFFLWFVVSCWIALVLSLIPLPRFSLPLGPLSIFTLLCRTVCYLIIALPHKRRVCALSFSRLPSNLQLSLYVFFVRVLCLTNLGFVECFAFSSVPFEFGRFVIFSDVLPCVPFLTSMRFVQCFAFGSLSISTICHIQ